MVSISKLKIKPPIAGLSEFESNNEKIQSINLLNEKRKIKINFNENSSIKSIEIPIDGLIEIKFKNDPEWDVRFCSFSEDIDIYYKKTPYPKGAFRVMSIGK